MASSNLPFVSSNIPPDLRQFLERVRETLGGDTFVRRVDYLGGTVPRNPGEPPGPGPNPIPLPCGSPVTPTAPTGFQVFPGFSGFLLQWDMPEYCGHDRTEVYGLRHDGVSDDLTVKNMLGESKGVLYSHVVQRPGDYWCFWIKHVNVNDVEGPFVAASKCGTTALDPGVLLNTLKKQISESELYDELGQRINRMDLTGTGLIKETATLRGQIEDLAQQISEVSVISGNRVFLQSSEPVPGDVCQYNGGVITAANKAACEALGGTWGHYGLRNGDYWYAIANGYNTPSAAGSVSLKIWAYTNAEYTEGAWGTAATKYLYKQATTPSGATSDLWYDTDSNSAVQWHLKVSSGWQPIVDGFVNIVADARIIDLEQARVGYCVNRADINNPITTDYLTRESCESHASHVWYPNLPMATAVKQVSVSTVDKCFISGGSYTDYCLLPPTTEAACVSAGGTWANYGTRCVDYTKETQAACTSRTYPNVSTPAPGIWTSYNSSQCAGMRDENSKPGLWVLGSSAAIEQKMQTLQDTSGALSGQYSLKIDAGGHVAGFGLSNELMADGTQISRFLVRADQFGVAGDSFAGPDTPVHLTDAVLYHGFSWYDTDHRETKYWQVTGAGSWTLATTSVPAFLTQETAPTTFLFAGRVWKKTSTGLIRYYDGVSAWGTTAPALIQSVTAPVNPFHGQAWWDTSGAGALKIFTFPASWTTDSAVAPIPFVVTTSPTLSDDGLLIPPGVYMDAAYIKDATITTAKIKDLAVDDAKIRDLSADKITAGTIDVDEYIQSTSYVAGTSGWRISGDGSMRLRGYLQGGSATAFMGGSGYFFNPTGYAHIGDPDGAFMSFNPNQGMIIGGAGIRSDNWNGTLSSAGVITAAGSTGWVIDSAGNAEFGTLHLRNGAVSDHQYTEARATSGLNGTSEWVSGANYTTGAIVWDVTTRNQYFCIANVTGGTTAPLSDTTHWMVYNDDPTISSITKWSPSTTYARGAKVWYVGSTYSGLYLSKSSSNTNHAPTNTQNGTYWLRYEHAPDIVTLPISITNVGTGLGTMVSARFLVYFESDLSGASPPERVVTNSDNSSRPDIYAQLILYGSDGTRTVLAEAGYLIPCVGKKATGGNHIFSATITDFTQIEGDASGTLALNIGNYAGFSSIPIYIQGTAMLATGAKR